MEVTKIGIPLKFLNPGNVRTMITLTKLSNGLSLHMLKRCKYCDLDLGTGDDYPVIEFVQHLAEKHLDKIKPEDIKWYEKLVKKATK